MRDVIMIAIGAGILYVVFMVALWLADRRSALRHWPPNGNPYRKEARPNVRGIRVKLLKPR